MTDMVLIHKRARGFYREEARGYAEVENAGLFTRKRAQEEVRDVRFTQIVELSHVAMMLSARRAQLVKTIENIDRMLLAAQMAQED